LELVHSDIAGPFRVESLGGARYYVTFIDDFSKMTWIYFMRSKGECLDKFKIFHREVENRTGKKLSILRSDNGGEYILQRSFTTTVKARASKDNLHNPTLHTKTV
jgi:hypothetical protein